MITTKRKVNTEEKKESKMPERWEWPDKTFKDGSKLIKGTVWFPGYYKE